MSDYDTQRRDLLIYFGLYAGDNLFYWACCLLPLSLDSQHKIPFLSTYCAHDGCDGGGDDCDGLRE